MLQIDITPLASDALEDAMRLAQTKSLNSYTFSDCMNYLNYAWSDIYNRISCIDSGYYSKTVRLTQKLTRLPPFVKNAIHVYSAIQQQNYNRLEYKQSSQSDLIGPGTYYISGTDLYCPDAERRSIWLEYVPSPPQIFFTHHNRDPKIYNNAYKVEHEGEQPKLHTVTRRSNTVYNMWILKAYYMEDDERVYIDITDRDVLLSNDKELSWVLVNRVDEHNENDITDALYHESEYGEWKVSFISCEFPYIFVSYVHSITSEHVSGFYTKNMEWTLYNPFEFQGINSNVEYVNCRWNDKTGMGVIVQDYNDIIDDEDTQSNGMPRVKEMGWTPDTKLVYPAPEVYRYLVARLADKLSALNESNVMGVQKELVESSYAFEAFLSKNKASMSRIINVNPASPGDFL